MGSLVPEMSPTTSPPDRFLFFFVGLSHFRQAWQSHTFFKKGKGMYIFSRKEKKNNKINRPVHILQHRRVLYRSADENSDVNRNCARTIQKQSNRKKCSFCLFLFCFNSPKRRRVLMTQQASIRTLQRAKPE